MSQRKNLGTELHAKFIVNGFCRVLVGVKDKKKKKKKTFWTLIEAWEVAGEEQILQCILAAHKKL